RHVRDRDVSGRGRRGSGIRGVCRRVRDLGAREPAEAHMSLYGGGTGGAWGVLKGPGMERCPKCGYDLRGLMEGGKCPECGTDTARHEALGPRMGRESPLGAAPRGYLALLLIGFLLCSVGIAGREIWTIMGVFGAGGT